MPPPPRPAAVPRPTGAPRLSQPPKKPPGLLSEDEAAAKIQARVRGRAARKHPPRPSNVAPPSRKPGVPLPSTRPPLSGEESAASKLQAQVRVGAAPPPATRQGPSPISSPLTGPSVTAGSAPRLARRHRGLDADSPPSSPMDALEHEIKDLKYQVAGKSKRIDELGRELNDRDETIRDKDLEIAGLTKTVARRDAAFVELEDQLKGEEDDFAMLGEALEKKELELQKKAATIVSLRDDISKEKSEVARQKVVISRQDSQMGQLLPPKEDVCLSARSFADNDLVRLRDEEIRVANDRIAIITTQNGKLREDMDRLEAELERMQFDLMQKDVALGKQRIANEDTHRAMDKIQKELKANKGQKAAMDVATKQNSQLLQLLQHEETKQAKSEKELSEASEELALLREKNEHLVRCSAEWEARATAQEALASKAKSELDDLRRTWNGRETQLRAELDKVRKGSQTQLETMQEELRARREKQYALLDRLQSAEGGMRVSVDVNDDLKEQIRVLSERNLELESRLLESRRWAEENERRHAELLRASEDRTVRQRGQNTALVSEKGALSKQLREMGATVRRAVDRQRAAEAQQVAMATTAVELKNEVESVRRRMVGEGALQGKRRVQAEMELGTLKNQLGVLRSENTKLSFAAKANFDEQQAATKTLEARCERLTGEVKGKLFANRVRLERMLSLLESTTEVMSCIGVALSPAAAAAAEGLRNNEGTFRSLLGSDPYAATREAPPASTRVITVPLAETNLTLEELKDVVGRVLRANDAAVAATAAAAKAIGSADAPIQGPLLALDLRGNGIDDRAMTHLTMLLRSASRLSRLDLRGNYITTEGVRALASAIESNPMLGLEHVYVHRDGLLEALGTRSGLGNASRGSGTAGNFEIGPILAVDVRGNGADADGFCGRDNGRSGTSTKRSHTRQRGSLRSFGNPNRDGGFGWAASRRRPRTHAGCDSSSDDLALSRVYSVDLEREARHVLRDDRAMTQSGTRCKSRQRPRTRLEVQHRKRGVSRRKQRTQGSFVTDDDLRSASGDQSGELPVL